MIFKGVLIAMKLEVTLQGRQRTVELTHSDERPRWKIDDREVDADALEISPDVYSVIVDGQSFEVQVQASHAGLRVVANGYEYSAVIENPRERKKSRDSAAEAKGRQNIVAPMAGKIVHTLVQVGDQVQSGQGLVIVEAMKMQNEVRSPKSGTIERLGVIEGQTVNPGDVVAVVS
jgi:biotin carboxyl carrier protein